MHITKTKSTLRVAATSSVIALALSANPLTIKDADAYGMVSRADCGFLNVLESITYTVFPWEFDDYLYVISDQWTRYYWEPYWTYRGRYQDGWDTVHVRAGEFFAYTNQEAGYVNGYHYSWTGGATTYEGGTNAGSCNLTNWY